MPQAPNDSFHRTDSKRKHKQTFDKLDDPDSEDEVELKTTKRKDDKRSRNQHPQGLIRKQFDGKSGSQKDILSPFGTKAQGSEQVTMLPGSENKTNKFSYNRTAVLNNKEIVQKDPEFCELGYAVWTHENILENSLSSINNNP